MALTWLILFVVAAIALAMLLWPDKGLAARWKSWRASVEREQVEDALKVLLDHKWEGLATSSDALVAHLRLSEAAVLRLVTRMEAQGLVQTRGSELALTAEGEQFDGFEGSRTGRDCRAGRGVPGLYPTAFSRLGIDARHGDLS